MDSKKLKTKTSIPPTRLIIISFLIVILLGTFLLTLPISSKSGEFTNSLDALFTATSATCVTGLVIYDTYLHWSLFGQMVILTLIQVGGLGLLTITTFFNILIGKKLGLRSMVVASESINISSVSGITSIVRMVIGLTFAIELIGAILLSTVFIPKLGLAHGFFTSIFLSISAFCNAGFDILGHEGAYSSLINYNDNLIIMGTIATLIVVGGLGFIVWKDIIDYRKTKKVALHTRIVLIVTGMLVLFGFISFFILEFENPSTMESLSFGEKIVASLFQSITTRTAGFNSIDIAGMRDSTKLISIVLMFIGAAPGSTGGGIKVTTFAVIVMTVVSVIKGRNDTVIMNRKVSHNVVYRSISIICLAILCVLICTIIISNSLDNSLGAYTGIDTVFESVSAFATVGLSSGISGMIGADGKISLIILMFIGRVGPVSLGISLAMKHTNKNTIMPEGRVIVG